MLETISAKDVKPDMYLYFARTWKEPMLSRWSRVTGVMLKGDDCVEITTVDCTTIKHPDEAVAVTVFDFPLIVKG